jgi:hypothetical protein
LRKYSSKSSYFYIFSCILNLDSWSYIKKHRMENLRHIKLISTYISFSYHVFLRLLRF